MECFNRSGNLSFSISFPYSASLMSPQISTSWLLDLRPLWSARDSEALKDLTRQKKRQRYSFRVSRSGSAEEVRLCNGMELIGGVDVPAWSISLIWILRGVWSVREEICVRQLLLFPESSAMGSLLLLWVYLVLWDTEYMFPSTVVPCGPGGKEKSLIRYNLL